MELTLSSPFDYREAYPYLGIRGTPGQAVEALTHECARKLTGAARPQGVYRVFALDGMALRATTLVFEGEDIKKHLAGCHACLLFAVTLGAAADELIRAAQVDDMAAAVTLDACASRYLEALCDDWCARLRETFSSEGELLTTFLSPGCGDLPMELQSGVLTLLDAGRQAGITATSSQMLLPQKSLTGVIGLHHGGGEGLTRSCAHCSFAPRCAYRGKCR